MKKWIFLTFALPAMVLAQSEAAGQATTLDAGWHHIRNADPREWSAFPVTAAEKKFILRFSAQPDTAEWTLSLRQSDVKLNWRILLNGKPLGALVADEKDLMAYFKVSGGLLAPENVLEISCTDAQPDDIRVGHIMMHPERLVAVLSEARVMLEVVDADSGESIPSRVTIVNDRGILQSVSSDPYDSLPVRPGYVYTGNGRASLGLPAGTYTFYANRGFEYGVDSVQLTLRAGDATRHRLAIKREVSTTGWTSSDTHIHTVTWSGHGDATAAERAVTIAGEGIELPIITDHNINVDFKPFAVSQGVDSYFTPVTGNEVTSAVGHFNVFPLKADEKIINHRAKDWKTLQRDIAATGDLKAIILNHARDIHVNFRPFDPLRHLSVAGMRLDGATLFANAMEVLNSGSQQTDQHELMRDWLALLNHGHFITPVGASDSHDVSRYFVGQARTYIRCNDDDPANIDVREAVGNFLEGNVMVSFGLLAEIEVNDTYGPGELVPASDELKVSVKVSGPSWTRANKVVLYANGKMIREEEIQDHNTGGVKWTGTWNLTTPSTDIFLVAFAEGPDDQKPFWPIAKPYQPKTPDWHPRILGLSGAVWVDGDKSGVRNSARDYAEKVLAQAGNNLEDLMQLLATFDEAVSIQTAALLHRKGRNLTGSEITKALETASPQTRSGFHLVIHELGARGQ